MECVQHGLPVAEGDWTQVVLPGWAPRRCAPHWEELPAGNSLNAASLLPVSMSPHEILERRDLISLYLMAHMPWI